MTTFSAIVIAVIAFLCGGLLQRGWYSRRRLKTLRESLRQLASQIQKLRLQLSADNDSGQLDGLVGWAHHHAARLIEECEEKRTAALGLAARDPSEAELLELEINCDLSSARSIIKCTERYLSKQARLDSQKMGEFLDDLEALRKRLSSRLERRPSLVGIREEQQRLERLGEHIAKERGTLNSDPAVGWRRIQSLLSVLNDIDRRLELKTGTFGPSGR